MLLISLFSLPRILTGRERPAFPKKQLKKKLEPELKNFSLELSGFEKIFYNNFSDFFKFRELLDWQSKKKILEIFRFNSCK